VPAAAAAAAGVPAGGPAAAGLVLQARQQGGCGALPRGHPRPGGSYRPPGLSKPPAGAAAQQQLLEGMGTAAGSSTGGHPPGFPAATGGVPAASSLLHEQPQPQPQPQHASLLEHAASRTPAAVAAGGSEPASAEGETSQAEADVTLPLGQPLVHISQPRTAVPHAPPTTQQQQQVAADGPAAGTSGSTALLLSAVRRLRARVSRYALRAAELDPAGTRAQEWAAKAHSCQEQLAQLERQLVLVCCRT